MGHEEEVQQDAVTAAAEVAVEPFGDESIRDELVIQAIDALDGPDVEVRPGLMSTWSAETSTRCSTQSSAHTTASRTAGRVITVVRLESRDGGIDFAQRSRQVDQADAS